MEWSKLSANVKLFYAYFGHANKLPLFILNATLYYKKTNGYQSYEFYGGSRS